MARNVDSILTRKGINDNSKTIARTNPTIEHTPIKITPKAMRSPYRTPTPKVIEPPQLDIPPPPPLPNFTLLHSKAPIEKFLNEPNDPPFFKPTTA